MHANTSIHFPNLLKNSGLLSGFGLGNPVCGEAVARFAYPGVVACGPLPGKAALQKDFEAR